MRKSRALGQALYREKKKRLGFTGAIPETAALFSVVRWPQSRPLSSNVAVFES
jgi:hypothetical protein